MATANIFSQNNQPAQINSTSGTTGTIIQGISGPNLSQPRDDI
jgi:hypothetical protein